SSPENKTAQLTLGSIPLSGWRDSPSLVAFLAPRCGPPLCLAQLPVWRPSTSRGRHSGFESREQNSPAYAGLDSLVGMAGLPFSRRLPGSSLRAAPLPRPTSCLAPLDFLGAGIRGSSPENKTAQLTLGSIPLSGWRDSNPRPPRP